VLHRLVLEHLETFRAQAASLRDGGRPADLSEEVEEEAGMESYGEWLEFGEDLRVVH